MYTTVFSKGFLFVAILSLICLKGISQADNTHAKDSAKLILEKGYPVKLVLVRDIGSSVAQAGNKVYFEVDSAITISDITIVPKGSKAYGTISMVKEAEGFGQGGKMAFSIDKIVMDNGRAIALTADYKAAGRSRVVQSVAGSILISGLFVHTKGKKCYL